MSTYFTLTCSPDGTRLHGPFTKEQLLEELAELRPGRFLQHIPNTDGFCFMMRDDEMLVIEGRIVQPKPKTVVEQYDV